MDRPLHIDATLLLAGMLAGSPLGIAFAETVPGPHAVSDRANAPTLAVLSLETVEMARLMGAARETDFSFAANGTRMKITYTTPAPVVVAGTHVDVQTNVRAPERRPRAALDRHVARHPAAPKHPAALKHLARTPQRNPARVWASVWNAEIYRQAEQRRRTAPHTISAPRRRARQIIADLHPAILPPASAAAATPSQTSVGVMIALPVRRRMVRTLAADRQRGSAPSAATDQAAYVPWAVRMTAAHNPRTGPVHNNPHMSAHTTAFSSTHKPGTVIVHVKEKRLYLVESPTTARVYPIGTARGALDILGETRITTRRNRPTWTPTPNQRRRDPTLPRRVEAGPLNPLGVRALGLGWRYRLIHGTADPASIGSASSDGCIRMLNDDVADLFSRVRVGNRVLVLASADAALTEWRPAGYVPYRTERRRITRTRIARRAKKSRSVRKRTRYAAVKRKQRRRSVRVAKRRPSLKGARAFGAPPATRHRPHRKR
ncbi:MAG: L,D-transpeptidase [Pseudomonadota bacterium]